MWSLLIWAVKKCARVPMNFLRGMGVPPLMCPISSHCDPTASHYIKVKMDGIFGHTNFQNEITWKRTSVHSSAKR